MKLLLADGSSQIHRTYHALARQGTVLTAPDGTPTGALISFLSVVRKAVRQHRPTHLAVMFDLRGPTFRHEKFPAYKAQRDKTPEDLVRQIELAREALAALRIPTVERQGFEADDVIATLASTAAAGGHDVVILSSDKDLLQLVGPHVVMHHALRDEIMDEAGAEAYFGVPPARVPDILAIRGDASDNIPGVKGIGDKGAQQLVERYGDVETILSSLPAIEADESLGRLRKRMATLLAEQSDDLRLARELVTLRQDVPLAVSLDDLAIQAPDADATRELFTRLGFTKLLADMGIGAGSSPAPAPASAIPAAGSSILRTEGEAKALAAGIRAAGRVALAGSGPSRLEGIALAVGAGQSVFVARDGDALRSGDLRAVLSDSAIAKMGHDLKPLLKSLARDEVALEGLSFDSMLASYVLDPSRRSHDLDSLAADHLGWRAAEDGATGAGPAQATMAFHSAEDSARDDARDAGRRADLALRLSAVLRPPIDERGLARVFDEIEMPLVPVLAEMESTGVLIDVAELESLRKDLDARLGTLTIECHRLAGREFNIASPKQLGEVLYDEMGLASTTKTATGARSTAQDVLEELAGEHPIVDLVLEHRELSKLVGTYVDVLPRLVDPRTGRVHTTYHQAVAATGRLSSTDPNLQNIPIRTELGRLVRKAFVAAPGHLLVGADYSQVELRIMAHLSGDEALCEAFARGEDIHRSTAAKMFHVMPELVTGEMRTRAKVINFGLLYGMTAHGVATRLGCSRAEAKALIDGYFGAYPRMRETVERFIEETRADPRHEARTLFGRVRPLEEIVSRNQGRRNFAERAAVNTVVQGTAADLMKLAMISAHRRLRSAHPGARLILQVHDELVAEVPEKDAAAALATMIEAMESVHELKAPLRAVGGTGRSWYDLK